MRGRPGGSAAELSTSWSGAAESRPASAGLQSAAASQSIQSAQLLQANMVKLTEDMIVARTRVSDMNHVKKLNCWVCCTK